MTKWFCTRCGYVYNEAEGDVQHGIAANTPFDQLPETWVCPKCKAGKDAFRMMGKKP